MTEPVPHSGTGANEDQHDHDHEYAQAHDHGRDHAHDHHHVDRRWGWLLEAIPLLHTHNHGDASFDQALESNERGIRAIKVSIVVLGLTTIFQIGIVWFSGSVALLADTAHNFVDAVNGVPLWIALILSRRAASRRYTYGYGRAEDLAGVVIVFLILVTAVVAGYESYQRIVDPQPLHYVPWLIAAALIGFAGNEAVAVYEMRVGRDIGSAALIADGQHARVDGLTSLAVLFSALGSWLGWPLVDPIVGLLITIAILGIVKTSAVTIWHRLMDAVDPEVIEQLERAAGQVPGVQRVSTVRARWVGHKLHTDVRIVVDEDVSTRQSHMVAEDVRHAVFHAQPRIGMMNVTVEPCGHNGTGMPDPAAHHEQPARQGRAASAGGS